MNSEQRRQFPAHPLDPFTVELHNRICQMPADRCDMQTIVRMAEELAAELDRDCPGAMTPIREYIAKREAERRHGK